MNAVRTFISLDELGALLRLADGHQVAAVTIAPLRYGFGIEVLLTGPDLPQPTENLGVHHTPNIARRALDEWRGIKDDRDGYALTRPAVAPSDPKSWPKFPGEGLDYTGATLERGDPGDEDIHTGGPR